MEECKECGAVGHGNMYCNTCRKIINKRTGLNIPMRKYKKLPDEEMPLGPEHIIAFIKKLDFINKKEKKNETSQVVL